MWEVDTLFWSPAEGGSGGGGGGGGGHVVHMEVKRNPYRVLLVEELEDPGADWTRVVKSVFNPLKTKPICFI
jgi:hypothetical protein